MILIANRRLGLREKCCQANERGCVMKMGIVIIGGGVSGKKNFLCQTAMQANADLPIVKGGNHGASGVRHVAVVVGVLVG
ncbi:hypothetical protein DD577_29290, partial [Klebsiella pneumoniae]